MNSVAVVGVGLIGGSFALALRKAGFTGPILGVSSPRTVDAALEVGAISRGATLEEAAAQCDLIYLAQPIHQILTTLEALGPIAQTGCLITDAGSTKELIVQKAAECVCSATFIGGHPMAGKEQRGIEHADAELFKGRPYVITTPVCSTREDPDQLRSEFIAWIKRIGAHLVEMSATEHDRTVALTSHLPQLLSTTLAATVQEVGGESATRVFGPGLLDMTRLALSAPDVWMSVLETNKPAVREAIKAFRCMFDEMAKQLEDDQILEMFSAGAVLAGNIRGVIRSTE